jgi:hypothetical protein
MPFWKLSAYACQIEILETLVCLMLTLNVETALPLDVLRRQLPSTAIMIHSMHVRFFFFLVNMIGYFLIFLLHISEILSRSCATKITC